MVRKFVGVLFEFVRVLFEMFVVWTVRRWLGNE